MIKTEWNGGKRNSHPISFHLLFPFGFHVISYCLRESSPAIYLSFSYCKSSKLEMKEEKREIEESI